MEVNHNAAARVVVITIVVANGLSSWWDNIRKTSNPGLLLQCGERGFKQREVVVHVVSGSKRVPTPPSIRERIVDDSIRQREGGVEDRLAG